MLLSARLLPLTDSNEPTLWEVQEMNKESKEPGQTITLPDGRQLGYLVVGEGKPVFWFHGWPSSRLELLCLKGIAASKHLQIVGIDRPGFGLSTYAHDKGSRDVASDVTFLADHLRLGRFGLVGFSAGGHHAVTCAALLAPRITKAVVICGLSLPARTSGMMLPIFRIGFRLGTMPIVGTWIHKQHRDSILEAVNGLDAYVEPWTTRYSLRGLPKDDAEFRSSPSENRDTFHRSMAEAYHQGADSIRAYIQEVRLAKKGWDVDLSRIPSGIVHIWHGAADRHAPVSNAYRNAESIPGSHLKVFKNEGHMFFLNHMEELGELLSS